MKDEILIRRASEGDQGAFRLLVERYSREIFNYFVRSTGSIEDSEDLTQQCFVNLHGSLRRYRGSASPRTFIYRIATNLAISFARRRKSPVSLDLLMEKGHDPVPSSSVDDPEDFTRARELRRAYVKALEKLPAHHALILDLRVGKELSYKEIAEATDRSESSVETIIHRAREALSAELAKYFGDEENK